MSLDEQDKQWFIEQLEQLRESLERAMREATARIERAVADIEAAIE